MATSTVEQSLKSQKKWYQRNGFKTVITLLALFFVAPIGVWLAWWWCDWPKSVKIAASIIAIALWAYAQYLAKFKPIQPVAFRAQPSYQIEITI